MEELDESRNLEPHATPKHSTALELDNVEAPPHI